MPFFTFLDAYSEYFLVTPGDPPCEPLPGPYAGWVPLWQRLGEEAVGNIQRAKGAPQRDPMSGAEESTYDSLKNFGCRVVLPVPAVRKFYFKFFRLITTDTWRTGTAGAVPM